MSDKWTVIEKQCNIYEGELGDGSKYLARNDDSKKSVQEFHLCFESKSAHVLTGERGKIILEQFADELNAKGYEPKFIKGKMICELSQAQRTKLALLQSPPLPL